jgi:hypothetical protein
MSGSGSGREMLGFTKHRVEPVTRKVHVILHHHHHHHLHLRGLLETYSVAIYTDV